MSSENGVYRVRSVNLGGNTRQTTWVRASCRREAEQSVRDRYSRHIVESCLERTPPADVDVQEVTPHAE